MPRSSARRLPVVVAVALFTSIAVATSTAAPAGADSHRPSYGHTTECGAAEITFTNPTPFNFAGDYRVDGEPASTNIDFGTGPISYYNVVNIPPGETVVEELFFPEDSGVHTVEYRLKLGAEQDWYLPTPGLPNVSDTWVEFTVQSDCEPPTPIWTPLPPQRLVDTRPLPFTTDDGLYQGAGVRSAGSTYQVDVAGRLGVPGDATAAIVNLTAAAPQANGYMTVYRCDEARPLASSINFTAGVNIANEIVAGLSIDGDLCIFTSTPTHIVLDVMGYVPAGSDYAPLVPARLADTRPGRPTFDGLFAGGGAPGAGNQLVLQVGGRGGVPADADAAVLNVAAVNAPSNGYVTVHPCNPTVPTASSLNHTAGVNRASEVVAALDSSGRVCLFTFADVDLVVDVVGFVPAVTTNFTALASPVRLLETRPAPKTTIDGLFAGSGPLAGGTAIRLEIGGRAGIPSGILDTVVMNLTAADPTGRGYATVYQCGTRPSTSNLNYISMVNGSNELIAGVADGSDVCIYVRTTTQLVVDVVGYTIDVT